MTVEGLRVELKKISALIDANKDYLVQLDQVSGDGDLGISMSAGFKAVAEYLEHTDEKDLGKVMAKAGSAFNESAPSSLGTILSFGFMGMAKEWKGKSEVNGKDIGAALEAGVNKIMEKTGSKPGERTVLDALCPAVEAYRREEENPKKAREAAASAAAQGAEATKNMKPVHGRAAYYGEKSMGRCDGGAVVGKLIFEAIAK